MYQQFQIAFTLEMNTIKIYFYCDFSFTERNCILSEQEHSGRRKRKHNSYLTNRVLAQQALKMMNAKTHEQ